MGSSNCRRRSPRRGAITARVAIFLAIVSVPLLWLASVFVNESLTGGIEQHPTYADVNLQRLGYFHFDTNYGTLGDVPARYRDLDGKRVVLTGFMYAGNSAGHVSSFEFVYNRTICCFGGSPLVQERVVVNVPNGDVPYCDDMVRIQGILHVNVEREAGTVISVYRLDLEKVEPL